MCVCVGGGGGGGPGGGGGGMCKMEKQNCTIVYGCCYLAVHV